MIHCSGCACAGRCFLFLKTFQMMNAALAARIGAVAYVLWGGLHLFAGIALVFSAHTDINGFLAGMATAMEPGAVPQLAEGTVVSGVGAFHSFNLAWLGAFVVVVALRWNWRNALAGFWVNAVLVGMVDLGLILFLQVPGYMAWADGIPGPVLYVVALVFSAIAVRKV